MSFLDKFLEQSHYLSHDVTRLLFLLKEVDFRLSLTTTRIKEQKKICISEILNNNSDATEIYINIKQDFKYCFLLSNYKKQILKEIYLYLSEFYTNHLNKALQSAEKIPRPEIESNSSDKILGKKTQRKEHNCNSKLIRIKKRGCDTNTKRIVIEQKN